MDQQFDVIVSNSPPQHSESRRFRVRKLAVWPVVICGAPNFWHLRHGFPKSLEAQPLIVPTGHGSTRHAIEDYFQRNRIHVQILAEAQDGELLRHVALAGHALVPLSPSTVKNELDRGELIQVGKLNDVFEELWIISMPRLHEHPIVEFLMNRRAFGQEAA
jgi:LysR family transcriptional activator of nhaA